MAYDRASEISSKFHQVAGVDEKPSSLHGFFKATLNLPASYKGKLPIRPGAGVTDLAFPHLVRSAYVAGLKSAASTASLSARE